MPSSKKPKKRSKKTVSEAIGAEQKTVSGEEQTSLESVPDPDSGLDAATEDAVQLDEPDALTAALDAKTQLECELEELQDRHLRLAAEFDNFRKRTVRERAQHTVQAQAELVRQLLESLDDLARVSELGSRDHDAATLLEGVRLVEQKLRTALEQLGLRSIDAAGQPFDPQLHEALVTVPVSSPDEDEVVSQELVKGYLFKETLLRPSRVEVKKYQPDASPEGKNPVGGSEGDS